MKKLLLLVFLIILTTVSFAADKTGKLYIFSKNAEDKIFLDGVPVGKANAWIEAIPEGKYKLVVTGADGKLLFIKEIEIKEGQISTYVVGEEVIQGKQKTAPPKDDLTPAFTIGLGINNLALTGNGTPWGVDLNKVELGTALSTLSIEINKNITRNVEVGLWLGFVSGYKSMPGQSISVSNVPISLNLRYVWESEIIFSAVYVGGGLNQTYWQAPYGTIQAGLGSQCFMGGYLGPLWILGSLQTEIGFVDMAGKIKSNSNAIVAQSFYFRFGWAF